MTKPIKHPEENVVYKGPTPEIGDLSCYRAKPGLILSEWDLTIAERLAIMRGATIELGIHTEPIPPVSLSIVKRPARACIYCGHRCTWRDIQPMRWLGTCRYCSDLPALDPNRCKPPTMRDELREALR